MTSPLPPLVRRPTMCAKMASISPIGGLTSVIRRQTSSMVAVALREDAFRGTVQLNMSTPDD